MLSESSHSGIIVRIEEEIRKLADKIRTDDEFGTKNVINVHGLVCLMRYAIWSDEDSFKQWLLEQKMSNNKGVVKRVHLHKDGDDVKDGVEIRIHLFTNGNETFRHNHGQDFITMCIHGAYEYSYYTVLDDKRYSYQKFTRTPGEGTLRPIGGEIKSGRIVKARLENGKLIPDENAKDIRFEEGDLPMYVPCDFHHTVNDFNKKVDVITIVARRARISNHKTTVIQDLSQGHRDAEDDQGSTKVKLTHNKKLEIFEKLKSALMRRGHSDISYSNTINDTKNNDLNQYMTKNKFLVKFISEDTNTKLQRQLIWRFLKSNDFTSAPVMEGKKCVSVLRRPVSKENEGELQIKSPPMVKDSEHILGAVLWNVVSKDLVVPIVNKDDEMMGIFSISDLVESNEEFNRALIYSIAKHKRTDSGEKIARKFLERLSDLNNAAFGEEFHSSDDLDSLVNELLLSLGPLITISPDLSHGRFINISQTVENNSSWIHQAANWPMYKLDVESFSRTEIDSSKLLLEMLSRGSEMNQILLDDGNEVKLLTTSHGLINLEISDKNTTIQDAIKTLSGSEIPLLVSDENGKFGILTKDDFNSGIAIKQLCKLVTENDIDPILSTKITEHVIRVGMGEDSTLEI